MKELPYGGGALLAGAIGILTDEKDVPTIERKISRLVDGLLKSIAIFSGMGGGYDIPAMLETTELICRTAVLYANADISKKALGRFEETAEEIYRRRVDLAKEQKSEEPGPVDPIEYFRPAAQGGLFIN